MVRSVVDLHCDLDYILAKRGTCILKIHARLSKPQPRALYGRCVGVLDIPIVIAILPNWEPGTFAPGGEGLRWAVDRSPYPRGLDGPALIDRGLDRIHRVVRRP